MRQYFIRYSKMVHTDEICDVWHILHIHNIYGAHPSKMAHKNLDCAPSAHNPKILELSLWLSILFFKISCRSINIRPTFNIQAFFWLTIWYRQRIKLKTSKSGPLTALDLVSKSHFRKSTDHTPFSPAYCACRNPKSYSISQDFSIIYIYKHIK